MYTTEQITKILKDNHFAETVITCPDGVDVVVKPCSYADKITDISQCDYFLCYGDLPWMGDDTVEKITRQINEHAKDLAELMDERKELRQFFDDHQANGWDDDSWSWYSDWHKDLYGYRPHGRVCGEYVEPYPGAYVR